MCGKRTIATIATHDVQLLKGPLMYDVKPPTQLKVRWVYYFFSQPNSNLFIGVQKSVELYVCLLCDPL